jgi:hypothetical protein
MRKKYCDVEMYGEVNAVLPCTTFCYALFVIRSAESKLSYKKYNANRASCFVQSWTFPQHVSSAGVRLSLEKRTALVLETKI